MNKTPILEIPAKALFETKKLTEPEVVEYVCEYLRNQGYDIERCNIDIYKRGIDIIATIKSECLKVEAKGATSSRPKSANYDSGFTRNQKRHHLAMALLKCCEEQQLGLQNGKNLRVGIALPDDGEDKQLVSYIKKALTTLKITTFLVAPDGHVSIQA